MPRPARSAAWLLNDWDTFWAVLEHPELPSTNVVQRALRHWVIA
jgi:hypothetical protein